MVEGLYVCYFKFFFYYDEEEEEMIDLFFFVCNIVYEDLCYVFELLKEVFWKLIVLVFFLFVFGILFFIFVYFFYSEYMEGEME